MSAERRFFCSVESRAHGEDVFGTVARIRSWFLLEYPGVWPRNAVEDSPFLSSAVRDHVRTGPWDRALLVRQTHRWDAREMSAFLVDSSPESPSISRYSVQRDDGVAGIGGAGQRVAGLMFGVCTHSRHDKCCAKFGNPVWRRLRDQAGERAWQCSHVGGDRFAANVVVFPHGIYYGRVTPDDVGDLVRASDAGQIWLRGYRGRSWYPRAIQVAEYFARRESGLLGFDDLRPAGRAQTDGDDTTALFDARDGRRLRVRFATVKDAWRQRLTCDSDEESGVAQYRLIGYEVE